MDLILIFFFEALTLKDLKDTGYMRRPRVKEQYQTRKGKAMPWGKGNKLMNYCDCFATRLIFYFVSLTFYSMFSLNQ